MEKLEKEIERLHQHMKNSQATFYEGLVNEQKSGQHD